MGGVGKRAGRQMVRTADPRSVEVPKLSSDIPPSTTPPTGRRFDGWLAAFSAARMLANVNYMMVPAAMPVLLREWTMSATEAGALSAAFQVANTTSVFVTSALADRVGAKRVFVASSIAAAITTIAFAVFATSFVSGLIWYAAIAMAQSGVYTASIILFAERYPPARRGHAMGWLLAAGSLAHALALLGTGALIAGAGYRVAFAAAAVSVALGTAIALINLRGTPNRIHGARSGPLISFEALRLPEARKVILGYACHTFELLGFWAWAPVFLAACIAARGAADGATVAIAAGLAGLFHLVGTTASLTMGPLSDRIGRRAVLVGCAAAAALCSLGFGWLIGWPIGVVLAVGFVYAFTTIGDSAVLSTALTEAAPAATLGSALALRSVLGFGAGALAPFLVGVVLDWTNPAGAPREVWGWAFMLLGLGGAGAAFFAWRLRPPRAT